MAPKHSRLAPTPSGLLHLGNAFSFWETWLAVRASGGTLRLRVDDLDASRSKPEWVEALFRDLEWLQLDWDLGPEGPEALAALHSQQLRLERYRQLLKRLRDHGLLYACDCTRRQLREASPTGSYPGTCRRRNLPLEDPEVAWRVRMADAQEERILRYQDEAGASRTASAPAEDFVVRRRDGIPAYQIASLADDEADGINWIVRGQDLEESTGRQLWLAQRAGCSGFLQARFHHHALLLDDSGSKLSKSKGALALSSLRESGVTLAELRRRFARWSGLPDEAAESRELLLQAFSCKTGLPFSRE